MSNAYPQHVAIIMDGNGRWANKRGLPRIAGHRAGVQVIKKIVPICEELGIKHLTLFAFSKENWTRPELEVKGLMSLLIEFLDRELKDMHRRNMRLGAIGNIEELDPLVQKKINDAIELTRDNTGIHIIFAINYGGRQEILMAVNRILEDHRKGLCAGKEVNADMMSSYLYTKGLPDPDLLIRTSGEERISNFLLWQLSYSEIYGTQVLWPDFDEKEFRDALEDYIKRERRYGDVGKSA